MLRLSSTLLKRRIPKGFLSSPALEGNISSASSRRRDACCIPVDGVSASSQHSFHSPSSSSPSLSIWRRKKEMGKEGLFVIHQLKRLGSGPRLDQFMRTHVSRLLRTDLLAVLAELQRQDNIPLSMKIYEAVRKEIWYHPDMFFYREMLIVLARNKREIETRQVWSDLQSEAVRFDQHTYGDIVRAFVDGGLPELAMEFYEEMRSSPDPPLPLPFRVILKGLIPFPVLREKVRDEFLELFPNIVVYDPPEDFDEE
ncbi:pentatricopeptide repeat-containing protein At1g62350 [Phalaenopsis equestris]|uniref:pentatricopeptide repeat-containing protein At1g62350 n=1 Tax=Phalaenopsis equestris TaxID=78828 RepID=UPI0009E1BE48|nr:pentatricopeptide repeat-containing protein At1g62350 [Phalaenopsis equestris]